VNPRSAIHKPGVLTPLWALVDNDLRDRLPVKGGDEDAIEWPRLVPFFVLHLGCLGAI
jgi:hypothetical protein